MRIGGRAEHLALPDAVLGSLGAQSISEPGVTNAHLKRLLNVA